MKFITRYLWSKLSITSGFSSARGIAVSLCLMGAQIASPTAAQTLSDFDPDRLEIVALGDSLTAGYGLAPNDGFVTQLQAALTGRGHNVRIINAGVSGDTTSGGRARLDWSVPVTAHAVILELGANDALRGVRPALTRNNLEFIIQTLQARGQHVVLAGMYAPPNLGRGYGDQFNTIYPDLAEKYGLILFPFFLQDVAGRRDLNLADRIHPNKDGIEIIVGNILPSVEQLITKIK